MTMLEETTLQNWVDMQPTPEEVANNPELSEDEAAHHCQQIEEIFEDLTEHQATCLLVDMFYILRTKDFRRALCSIHTLHQVIQREAVMRLLERGEVNVQFIHE